MYVVGSELIIVTNTCSLVITTERSQDGVGDSMQEAGWLWCHRVPTLCPVRSAMYIVSERCAGGGCLKSPIMGVWYIGKPLPRQDIRVGSRLFHWKSQI